MTLRLTIDAAAYLLERQAGDAWEPVAVLPGGAGTLLPGGRTDAGGLEAAIEVAEDWLMPHAAGLRGQALEIADRTGRVASGLAAVLDADDHAWSVERVEALFLRLVDLATGARSRIPDGAQAFVADMLLVRELAHHGRLAGVRLLDAAGPTA